MVGRYAACEQVQGTVGEGKVLCSGQGVAQVMPRCPAKERVSASMAGVMSAATTSSVYGAIAKAVNPVPVPISTALLYRPLPTQSWTT